MVKIMVQVKVLMYVESRYRVNRKRVKKSIVQTLEENSISSPCEVSVALVGDRKMRSLNKKYRGKDQTTNVLSFSINEGKQPVMPLGNLRLGDIVISYPQVIREAAREEVLVDDKIDQLVKHGLLHLLGIHH